MDVLNNIPTEIIVAIIGGIVGVIGTIGSLRVTHRDRLTHAYNELASTMGYLQNQIDVQDKKIENLKRNLDDSQKTIRDYEERDDEKTAYIRSLGHWFEKTCSVLDPIWLKNNPKPKLPDSLRDSIGKEVLK